MAILYLGGGICELAAYTPQGLNGKYQFGTIDTWNTVSDSHLSSGTGSFTRWIPWLYSNYKRSAQTTRESWCPSAMVDLKGDLYTATFYQFIIDQIKYYSGFEALFHKKGAIKWQRSNGPVFRIQRFVSNTNNTVSVSQTLDVSEGLGSKNGCYPHYPDPGKRGSILAGSVYSKIGKYLGFYGQCSMHGIFSPTIAQEMSTSNEIYLVMSLPPSTMAYSNKILVTTGIGNYGWHQHLCLMKINKNNFKNNFRIYLSGSSKQSPHRMYNPRCQPFRTTSWNYKLQPEWGSFRAAVDSSRLHIFKLAYASTNLTSLRTESVIQYYKPYSRAIESGHKNGSYYTDGGGDIKQLGGFSSATIDGCILLPRFQMVNNIIYWGTVGSGYDHCLGALSGTSPTLKGTSSFCTKIENSNTKSTAARYPTDFCVIPNGNNPVACWLGFGYNHGWSRESISWADNKLVCALYSSPLSRLNWQTCQSNTLYVTDVVGGNSGAVNSSNTSAADRQRLYLNTQNIVSYTAASGRTYMIYAYCYPGKAKCIYLGYAPYVIDSTSHVRLYTKREFRDKSGNTFGDFSDCSRIISMDLKNNHLWITFMNGNSTAFRYFHIKASDLVGE